MPCAAAAMRMRSGAAGGQGREGARARRRRGASAPPPARVGVGEDADEEVEEEAKEGASDASEAPTEAPPPVGFAAGGMRRLARGLPLDVRDHVGKWLPAAAVDVEHDEEGGRGGGATLSRVFVHYSGWDSKWDEWVDARAEPHRLAAFGTFSAQSRAPAAFAAHQWVWVYHRRAGAAGWALGFVRRVDGAQVQVEYQAGAKIFQHWFHATTGEVRGHSGPPPPPQRYGGLFEAGAAVEVRVLARGTWTRGEVARAEADKVLVRFGGRNAPPDEWIGLSVPAQRKRLRRAGPHGAPAPALVSPSHGEAEAAALALAAEAARRAAAEEGDARRLREQRAGEGRARLESALRQVAARIVAGGGAGGTDEVSGAAPPAPAPVPEPAPVPASVPAPVPVPAPVAVHAPAARFPSAMATAASVLVRMRLSADEVRRFGEHGVTMAVDLLDLSEGDMERLVSRVGPRSRLRAFVAAWRAALEAKPPFSPRGTPAPPVSPPAPVPAPPASPGPPPRGPRSRSGARRKRGKRAGARKRSRARSVRCRTADEVQGGFGAGGRSAAEIADLYGVMQSLESPRREETGTVSAFDPGGGTAAGAEPGGLPFGPSPGSPAFYLPSSTESGAGSTSSGFLQQAMQEESLPRLGIPAALADSQLPFQASRRR